MKTVVVISETEGMVVRGIMNKLSEAKEDKIRVAFTGDNTSKKELERYDADIFIISFDGIDEMSKLKGVIGSASELAFEKKKEIYLVCGLDEYSVFTSSMPYVTITQFFRRPVDLDQLLAFVIALDGRRSEEKKSILLVDDDPAYAKMVRSWIREDYKTAVVTSGVQAVSYLAKNKVDLILLDYEMPVVSGPQVLEMIRSEKETADIPVVFLTGVNTREEIQKVMLLKPDGYILKSTGSDKIKSWLADFFSKR
jgi:CheY-like chemotaxis protein